MIVYNRSLDFVFFMATLSAACKAHCQTEAASPAKVRRSVAAALNSMFPATPGDRRAQAERFVSLYAAAGELPPAERARLRLRLKSRLTRLASGIRQDLREARGRAANTSDSPSQAADGAATKTAGRAGGAPQDEGQALVDLIEATIAPETWDVNGGPGTIKYWPAWHALVVRQTDDVHEQLGGVVRGLRQ